MTASLLRFCQKLSVPPELSVRMLAGIVLAPVLSLRRQRIRNHHRQDPLIIRLMSHDIMGDHTGSQPWLGDVLYFKNQTVFSFSYKNESFMHD